MESLYFQYNAEVRTQRVNSNWFDLPRKAKYGAYGRRGRHGQKARLEIIRLDGDFIYFAGSKIGQASFMHCISWS